MQADLPFYDTVLPSRDTDFLKDVNKTVILAIFRLTRSLSSSGDV